MQVDYDVIIVGGGGGGMAAALSAHKNGASVIILEADTRLGGATKLSGGVVYAAGTSVQRAAGINDTPQAMFDYVMTLNRWGLRADLIKLMSERSAETIEWLISLGAEYNPDWTVCSGVDTVPRGHPTVGAGESVARVLANEVGAQGIQVAVGTRVEALVEEHGRVCGIRTADTELRARSVIITTGGFGNNPGMRARLYPSVAQHGDNVFAVHDDCPFILGDGIKMAEIIGAGVVGHDTGNLLPSAGLEKFVEAFLPPWIVLVNDRGRRFMAESAPYSVSGYLINEQPGARAFAIFDEPTLVAASADKRFADPYHTGHTSMTWDEQMIRRFVEKGVVKTADTIAGLAAKINIDAIALAATIRRCNADAPSGVDSEFFKKAPQLFTVQTPPFYAVEIRPSIIGVTGAGLDIDTSARVRDVHGEPIPGLFAAGEVLGCIHGQRYAGGGMGIGNALLFGRIAGATAAAEALRLNTMGSAAGHDHELAATAYAS